MPAAQSLANSFVYNAYAQIASRPPRETVAVFATCWPLGLQFGDGLSHAAVVGRRGMVGARPSGIGCSGGRNGCNREGWRNPSTHQQGTSYRRVSR